MIIYTTPGKTYCVTSSASGCEINCTNAIGLSVTLLSLTGEGQGYFTAPSGEVYCSSDEAMITECKGGFSGASAGSSAGGGAKGLIYTQAVDWNQNLCNGTVYDLGQIPTSFSLLSMTFEWSGTVETCEIWMMTAPSGTPVISFPASWVWIGGLPDISKTSTSYRIVVRREPDRIVANLAYSV